MQKEDLANLVAADRLGFSVCLLVTHTLHSGLNIISNEIEMIDLNGTFGSFRVKMKKSFLLNEKTK